MSIAKILVRISQVFETSKEREDRKFKEEVTKRVDGMVDAQKVRALWESRMSGHDVLNTVSCLWCGLIVCNDDLGAHMLAHEKARLTHISEVIKTASDTKDGR